MVTTILLLTALLPMVIVALAIRVIDGGPVFHISERMRSARDGFSLIKFRTMHVADADAGVSGGDKAGRITWTGRILRRSHLDELPQLVNVLRGDISLVGPRPPLRQYVEAYPDLYARVLRSRPGITGLASLVYHRHEDWLLARSGSAAETDAIYRRGCIPQKARLDLIYQRERSLCLDTILILATAVPSLHAKFRDRRLSRRRRRPASRPPGSIR